jgi:hypothetical protein
MSPLVPLVNVKGGECIGDVVREPVCSEDACKLGDVAVDGDAIRLN